MLCARGLPVPAAIYFATPTPPGQQAKTSFCFCCTDPSTKIRVIKASRKIRENWKRRLGSLLYNLECRALFDLPYWDINGTPKVFGRHFIPLIGT